MERNLLAQKDFKEYANFNIKPCLDFQINKLLKNKDIEIWELQYFITLRNSCFWYAVMIVYLKKFIPIYSEVFMDEIWCQAMYG